MQVATLDYDDYLGYVAIGRIGASKIAMGDRVLLSHKNQNEQFRVAEAAGIPGAQAVPKSVRRGRHRCRDRHERAERRRDNHVDRVANDPADADGR